MHKKFNFGTDGIRGNANQYPFLDKTLNHLGMAIAKWSIKKYKKQNPKVLIGHDTRISATKIKNAITKGLLNFPLNVVDGQTLPTPAVCKLIQSTKGFNFGIIISASHNSYQDNGIKLFDAKKNKLNKVDEELIIKLFQEIESTNPEIKTSQESKQEIWNKAGEEYEREILSFFEPGLLKGLKIVLDCANGATFNVAPSIFKHLGAQIVTICINPDGKNINKNCGALHLEKLQKTVVEQNADFGFAFDGDGDRVIAVTKNGHVKDGDDILALLTNHPKFVNLKTVIGTVMTNLGFQNLLEKNNKSLIRTTVGDKFVAEKLEKNNLLLGGESCGHIIMKDYMNTGDGIFTALRILQTALITKNFDIKTFKKTPQVLMNVPVEHKNDLSALPYKKIIEEHKNLLKKGRLIVRYSGTENLLRIMAETEKASLATNITKQLATKLQQALSST